jgi:hypothetical protein
MNNLLEGMVRKPDHATSEAAAESVGKRKLTIRARVLAFAERSPGGFIDEDLRALDPDAPESSYRKRRTELTADGLLVDSGLRRKKLNGELAIVWCHRKFHPAPPPLVEKVRGKAAKAIQRNKREARLFNALVVAAHHHHRMPPKDAKQIADALGIPHPINFLDIPAQRPL